MIHELSSRHNYVSRSTGRSASAAWGYISASKIVDPVTHKTFNYENKNHVAFTHVIVPDHAHPWMKKAEAAAIFQAADLYEQVWADRRFYKNKEYAEAHKSKATTARTAHFTLPNEFDLKIAQEIADKFVRERFVRYGVAAAYAVHNDPGNLHFHVIATQRVVQNDQEGFGVKAEIFKNAATMSAWARDNRQYLTDLSNAKLRELGIDKVVECRSFEERGIELEPQKHEGVLAKELNKGLRENNYADQSEKQDYAQRVNYGSGQSSGQNYDRSGDQNYESYSRRGPTNYEGQGFEGGGKRGGKSGGKSGGKRGGEGQYYSDSTNYSESQNHESYRNQNADGLLNQDRDYSGSYSSDQSHKNRSPNQFNNQNFHSPDAHGDNRNASQHYKEFLSQGYNKSEHYTFNRSGADGIVNPSVGNSSQRSFSQDYDPEIYRDYSQYITQAEQENEEIRERNQQRVLEDYDLLLRKLTSTQATFTEKDLASECFKIVEGDDLLYTFLMNKIMGSDDLVSLREDYQGRLRYTTKGYLQQESQMFSLAEHLYKQRETKVDEEQFWERLNNEELKLNEEQRSAALSIVGEHNLALISGVAGSGKTTMLRPAAAALQEAGYEVIGLALAGTAAANLQHEVGIKSETIHSFLSRQGYLSKKSIFLVDEAGMIGTSQMEALLSKAASSGAAVRLIGDDYQLSAVAAGDAFRGLRERFGAVRVSTVVRQQQDWERKNIGLMSEHQNADALTALERNGRIKWDVNRAESIKNVVETYIKYRQQDHNVIISAYERKDVEELNLKVRSRLVELGVLEQGIKINERFLSPNDRIMFLLNDRKQEYVKIHNNPNGVMNGNIGVVQEVSEENISVLLNDNRVASFNPAEYNNFRYAYAATGHKLQGATIDVMLNLISKSDNANSFYVNLSRGKHENYVFVDQETFKNIRGLESLISRSAYKDLVCDWQFSSHRELVAYSMVDNYLKICKASTEKHRVISAMEEIDFKGPDWKEFMELISERKELANRLIMNWNDNHLFVKQGGLRHHEVMIHAGLRERTKTALEIAAEGFLKQYRQLALDAREVWNKICTTHVGSKARQHEEFLRFEVLREQRDKTASLINVDLCHYLVKPSERKSIKERTQDHFNRVAEKEYISSLERVDN